MPERSRLCALLAILLIALLPPLTVGATQSSPEAAAPPHRAGLVVQHGDGALTYAIVAFPEDTISGIDLLRRSGIEHLSIPFGALGEGVCQIEREGCEVSECRRTVCQATRTSPYWQYLDQTPDQAWRSAPLGASGSRVEDGDVLAWVWTAETPVLPVLDLGGVASAAGVTLEQLGQGDVPVAVLRSDFTASDDPVDSRALIGGGGALLLIASVGGALLVARRRRLIAG